MVQTSVGLVLAKVVCPVPKVNVAVAALPVVYGTVTKPLTLVIVVATVTWKYGVVGLALPALEASIE
jgi:uncharacterized protein (DUF2062 family)